VTTKRPRKRAPSKAARAAQAKKTETEGRIDRILDLMTSGTWIAGRSHRQLAVEWGITVTTVERLAAEASRVLRRFTRGERELIKARMIAGIEAIRLRAEMRQRVRYRKVKASDGSTELQEVRDPDPDFTAALRAYELQARMLGLLQNELAITGADGGPIEVEHGVVLLPAREIIEVQESSALPSSEAKKLNGKGDGER